MGLRSEESPGSSGRGLSEAAAVFHDPHGSALPHSPFWHACVELGRQHGKSANGTSVAKESSTNVTS
jgi:hypothetical protein